MKKHKYNIFPEAKEQDYRLLVDDIDQNGYDEDQPITIYQGAILDGWNRFKACSELKVKPTSITFNGSDSEAIQFVMRTNKRRNLNSGQWATIAAEAEDIMDALRVEAEKARAEKASSQENRGNRYTGKVELGQKIVPPLKSGDHKDKTATKSASLFNTNRTYVNNAVKLKKDAPEVFEKVKAGKMTMQDGMREYRKKPTNPWLDDETERKEIVLSGQAVTANAERDKNLILWAESKGLAVRIDRGSVYGNPFILGKDGDRDQVCDNYRDHYLPHKPSIKKADLKGKVLVCHCYPDRCHGDALID